MLTVGFKRDKTLSGPTHLLLAKAIAKLNVGDLVHWQGTHHSNYIGTLLVQL